MAGCFGALPDNKDASLRKPIPAKASDLQYRNCRGNLPCDYVLHTVGPIIEGSVTAEDERLLASCYRSCLELAEQNGVESIAFCCISTGVFHFPNQRAAEIAVETVRCYKAETGSETKVIFNVFKSKDKQIYERLLAN